MSICTNPTRPLVIEPNGFEIMRTPSPKPLRGLRAKTQTSHQSKLSMGSCDTTFDDNLLTFSKDTFSLDVLGDISDVSSTKSGDNSDENYTLLNSTLNQKKKAMTDQTKYKTELCKKFTETGHCPYGKKCKFAHGKEELNEKTIVDKSRYKSRKCNSFHTQMTCPYGTRCLFLHEGRTIQELNDANRYGRFILFPELMGSGLIRNKARLPAFAWEEEGRGKPETQNETLFYSTFPLASQRREVENFPSWVTRRVDQSEFRWSL